MPIKTSLLLLLWLISFPVLAQDCCRYCKNSQACGNACIPKSSQCKTAAGCACSIEQKYPSEASQAILTLENIIATATTGTIHNYSKIHLYILKQYLKENGL